MGITVSEYNVEEIQPAFVRAQLDLARRVIDRLADVQGGRKMFFPPLASGD